MARAITVDGITKRFETVTALDDISFSIDEGELFGLLGPNGAGKSTLIHILSTLLQPTDGDATVSRHDVQTDRDGVRNSIGVGLIFASRISDFQAFNLIFNFLLFPLLFLSGAIYPVTNFPTVLQYVTYLNPLTYGIDGLRGVLVGVSMFSPLLDFIVMVGFALVFVIAGAYAFEGSDAV